MSQPAELRQPMIRSLVAEFAEDTQQMTMRRNLSTENLDAALQTDARIWIDIVDPTEAEIEWLALRFEFSPAVLNDLTRADRRPTLMVYPKYLFLSLFEPRIKSGQVVGQEIHCVMTDNCFITVRPSSVESSSDAYDRAAQNPDAWSAGVAYLLYLTAQRVVDAYYPLLDRISNQLNTLEESLMSLNGVRTFDDKARRPIYRIKQQLINLRQMVAPQREVISSVIGETRLGETDNIRDLFRHLYERLLRVYDVIDSQRDLSSNVLDVMQNLESQRMVEAVNRLTIFSMIFLPLTFLSTFFELNFVTTSQPVELPIHGSILFVLIVLAMIASTVTLTLTFRRRGWL